MLGGGGIPHMGFSFSNPNHADGRLAWRGVVASALSMIYG